jgi:CMP/dCMP kinase
MVIPLPPLVKTAAAHYNPARMIITIDGPAGTGKSTVAQTIAERLGFDFLDTGAMYRAIGLEALRREADLENHRELAFIAKHAGIEFDWSHRPPIVLLKGEPVGHLLRGAEATRAASFVAVVPEIREILVREQQRIGRSRPSLVTEGRDQGTVVFPEAQLKFFLDATAAERARRRVAQLRSRGEIVDYQEILAQIEERDTRDRSRKIAPMRPADDARVVDTTTLSQQQVVDIIISAANERTAEAKAKRG